MKVAVIYSGALRTFDKTWPNHKWAVWRRFPGAKFYCVAHDDEDAWKTKMLPTVTNFKLVNQPEMVIPQDCPPQWNGPRTHYMHEPYAISVSPQAVLGQLWMLREGWRLYQEANDPADLVIRIRPDLWFHRFDRPKEINGFGPDSFTAFTPWWGRFGGCNDRFALLGPKAAESYFTAYDHIPAMIAEGAPLHPETLIYYAMKRAGIIVNDTLDAEFSTLRKNGEMRPPEILASDIAHYAKSK